MTAEEQKTENIIDKIVANLTQPIVSGAIESQTAQSEDNKTTSNETLKLNLAEGEENEFEVIDAVFENPEDQKNQ